MIRSFVRVHQRQAEVDDKQLDLNDNITQRQEDAQKVDFPIRCCCVCVLLSAETPQLSTTAAGWMKLSRTKTSWQQSQSIILPT